MIPVKVKWKRRMAGGLVGFLGFLLSPLSWWNDLFINIPLAVGFGWLVSLAYRPLFEPAVVVGYWLTNLIGLILLHKGGQAAISDAPARPYTRKALFKDIAVSLIYTALILVMIRLKVLRGPTWEF